MFPDLKGLFGEVKKRMDGQIEFVRKELAGVRTGRASTGLLENVHVEAYGSKMPLNQVASLSIPEPSMIVAQPFDPSLMAMIEKAIRTVRSRPQSGQRRQGHPHSDSGAHRRAAQGAVAARPQDGRRRPQPRAHRAPRRERQAEEDAQGAQISEDDEKRALDEVQKITDQHIKMIDELQQKKDQELLGK